MDIIWFFFFFYFLFFFFGLSSSVDLLISSVCEPVTLCDDTATTSVRISPSTSPTVVVWAATTVAWYLVPPQGSIADVPSALGQWSSVSLRIHHHLVVFIDTITDCTVAGSEAIGGIHLGAINQLDLAIIPTIICKGKWLHHQGKAQEEEDEPKSETHLGFQESNKSEGRQRLNCFCWRLFSTLPSC